VAARSLSAVTSGILPATCPTSNRFLWSHDKEATMPRVTTHTKANAGKKVYRCQRCGQPVEPGQKYYYWSRRVAPNNYQHVDCGYPRPTQLSGRKTAAVLEAAQDAENAVGSFDPEVPTVDPDTTDLELDVSDLESALEDAAQSAEDVADEYEEGVSNMPDALQYSPTAEAMNDVAERLRDWAEQLRSPDFETNVTAEESSVESWEEAWAEAVSAARDAATDLLGDVPEYEG
jgi:hypothetical protein